MPALADLAQLSSLEGIINSSADLRAQYWGGKYTNNLKRNNASSNWRSCLEDLQAQTSWFKFIYYKNHKSDDNVKQYLGQLDTALQLLVCAARIEGPQIKDIYKIQQAVEQGMLCSRVLDARLLGLDGSLWADCADDIFNNDNAEQALMKMLSRYNEQTTWNKHHQHVVQALANKHCYDVTRRGLKIAPFIKDFAGHIEAGHVAKPNPNGYLMTCFHAVCFYNPSFQRPKGHESEKDESKRNALVGFVKHYAPTKSGIKANGRTRYESAQDFTADDINDLKTSKFDLPAIDKPRRFYSSGEGFFDKRLVTQATEQGGEAENRLRDQLRKPKDSRLQRFSENGASANPAKSQPSSKRQGQGDSVDAIKARQQARKQEARRLG